MENTAVHSQYKAEDGKLHEEERDVSKYWKKHGIKFALFGPENQTNVDRDIPFRIAGYDGASYRSQNVFEIAWLTEEQLKLFKSDFGIVANFFVQKRRNKDYVPDDKRTIQHVDEVLKLLSVMTGDQKYESVLYEEKGRVNSMCEVAERLVNKGLHREPRLEKKLEKRLEKKLEKTD